MMSSRPLRYLSLLGLLGLLGVVTGNTGFYGFFGFFGFAGLGQSTTDERLHQNLGRAGLLGFKVSLVGTCALVVTSSIWGLGGYLLGLIAVIYVLQLSTFVISFNYFDARG